jgi:peptidyl-tRNA hydrolase
MAKPVMYIFVNKGLGMSTGKVGAQVGHGAIGAYKLSRPDITAKWEEGGHTTKLVMQARDTEHLLTIERYLNDRGFATHLVIDEGRTEIAPFTPTVLGVEIVDKSDPHTLASFESFETYKDAKPDPAPRRYRWLLKWLEPKQEGHYQNAGI